MAEQEQIRLKYSDKLVKLLKELEEQNNYVAFEMLYLNDSTSKYHNGLRISSVDLGPDYSFLVTIDDKKHPMKIGKFIRYFFPGIFEEFEIKKFTDAFNKLKNGKKPDSMGKKIIVPKFSYNPKDPRSTFLSLVTKTYPHGNEDQVLQFLPPMKRDKFGNCYKIIGNVNPQTMFTSHLDTADREQKVVNLLTKEENGDEIIYTDGSSILGADDKAGVVVMLYMMAHNIPGLYYFFIGEERGGIGSNALSAEFDRHPYLANIKRCVSFDRRRTVSVITSQLGRVCCSNEFGSALCNEYSKSGINLSLDPTGIYTDSASFLDEIAECTNISVGYENEHTGRELQNMTYLTKLCKASLNVNWNSLPTVRKVGMNQMIVSKYRMLIQEIKKARFGLDVRIVGEDNSVFIRVDMEETDIEMIHTDLVNIQNMLVRHKLQAETYITGTYLKIELK
jgi:hypothetical protein